jgi:hypothetical protein
MQEASTYPVTARNRRQLRGQKPPLKPKEIWAIRIRLQLGQRARDLALFNLAIDSRLRGCDLTALKVHDVAPAGPVASRAIVMQRKTQRPVQFEITDQTRDAVGRGLLWLAFVRTRTCFRAARLIAPSVDSPVRAYRPAMGRLDRARAVSVRDTLNAPHKGDVNLSSHSQHSRGATAARSHEVGKYGALPGYRSGRRFGDRRADRSVIPANATVARRSHVDPNRTIEQSKRPPDLFADHYRQDGEKQRDAENDQPSLDPLAWSLVSSYQLRMLKLHILVRGNSSIRYYTKDQARSGHSPSRDLECNRCWKQACRKIPDDDATKREHHREPVHGHPPGRNLVGIGSSHEEPAVPLGIDPRIQHRDNSRGGLR